MTFTNVAADRIPALSFRNRIINGASAYVGGAAINTIKASDMFVYVQTSQATASIIYDYTANVEIF